MQDEHAEQLRATAFLAALVAGFDLVALIQFNFTASKQDFGVLLCFGITNSLTVRHRKGATVRSPLLFKRAE